MKDIFRAREINAFVDLAIEFGDSLASTFPECEETKEWLLWLRNVVGDDADKRLKAAETWRDSSQKTIAKGSARYAKAVQSITGSPALVYHAVAYKDVDAWHASDENIAPLNFPAKLKKFSDTEKDVFWEFVETMNDHVYKGLRAIKPRVPTVDEISENIKARKNASTPTQPPTFKKGVVEIWSKLCAARGVAEGDACKDVDVFSRRVNEASKTCLDVVREKTPDGQKAMLEAFPELVKEGDFDDETWTLCDKLLSVSSMDSVIPSAMMKGIESVASSLMKDIESGKTDLGNLDIERIGQQVLNNVSEDDVSNFAANLDKILPALSRMQP